MTDPNTNIVKAAEEAELIATWRIEVLFNRGRTPNGPNACVLTFWRKGSRFGGGGDELVYLCMEADSGAHLAIDFVFDRRKKGTLGCGSVIPPEAIQGGVAYCPNCDNQIKAADLTGQIYQNLSSQDLADYCAEMWYGAFKGDADLYLKYHTEDIHFQEMVMRLGSEKTRQLRGLQVYPLSNIIKDTAAGKEVSRAFRECLSA
tara:strand:+ start:761 stop:1369 length:609 start_codon:yes stop_codon:yes gene_type:complete